MNLHALKSALNLCLVITFMAMQLSSAHIHVAEHHQHDGSEHAHLAKAHSHALSDHHLDAFDTSSSSANSLVVEMTQESLSQSIYQADDAQFISYPTKLFSPNVYASESVFLKTPEPRARWLHYSTLKSRAPPVSLT